ncbi:MAG: hypothetical protein NVV74_11380 [Magnetospirillum sp.]|nr:hypothetical protein [Magnetospirillum sp.]
MRLLALVLLLLLPACGGYRSAPVTGSEQSAVLPPGTGNDATRDGFYDGGIYDPDLTRRVLRLPE